MQFPESWLREFCNPPISTDELADLLTMAGLEVEEMRPVAPPFTGVVVGEIVEAVQHPNADKLRVCKVDAGALSPDGPLQIVCGAPNARVGIRVPLAMVGAELPPSEEGGKPFNIGVGKLRGVDSHGMLCSARELKLADDHGGLLELPLDTPVGMNLRDALKLDDTLFTLKLTPNLAHNLSVLGVAREVSALTGTPLNLPTFTPVKPTHDDNVPVRIEAARPVRPLGRTRRARRRPEGEDAGVDRRPPGALRPAFGVAAGRHLQLRDVRAGPPVAHLRPREDPRRAGDPLGQAGRDAQAAERQHRGARREGRRRRRQRRPRVARRHHGRRRLGRVRRHHQRLRRGRVLVARRPSPAARAASTSPPTPATASSAASTPRRSPRTSSASRS